MKVHLAQINPTPLDFEGNVRQHIIEYKIAVQNECDICVFPELSIPGYLCADKMYKRDFVLRNKESLRALRQVTEEHDTMMVVGYVDANLTGQGKPFKNMLAVIHRGEIIGTYQKWLLPFYDVFDEPRYYAAGKDTLVMDIAGMRCGFTICEDLWNDKGQDDYNHLENPIQKYRELGVEVMINISSSPYSRSKPILRERMISKIAGDFKYLVYVNQYGGMDELVFDGRSSVFSKATCKMSIVPPYKPIHVDDIDEDVGVGRSVELDEKCPYFDQRYSEDHLKMALLGLHDYAKKCGINQFVVGSSGGIDSAVVIAMAATVFDPKSVHCIKMPGPYSSDRSVEDATALHEALGTTDWIRKIDRVEEEIHRNVRSMELDVKAGGYNSVADENIQARARGQVVMFHANAINALALTTGNKTEMALGYCTLYGDMNGGFNPLVDVEKMQVYEFARLLNKYHKKEVVPQSIIDAAPSAELAPGQTDEASLLPYPILDFIVRFYVEEYVDEWDEVYSRLTRMDKHGRILFEESPIKVNDYGFLLDESSELLKAAKEKYDDMIRRVDFMEYKRRQATIGTRLTPKAFGVGRRMPIVKGRG